MVRKAVQQTSNSLKTVYLYLVIVFIIILISLLVKGFYIIKQSKYDPTHHFTLAVTKQNNVKEIISIHPQTPSLSVFIIQNKNLPVTQLAKEYGIATNGTMQIGDSFQKGVNVSAVLWDSIIHTASWQSNLTLFDKIRLFLFAKNVITNNKAVAPITLQTKGTNINTTIMNGLVDQDIATENVSIQIINATTVSGLGERLARVLTNLGANVIDLSTAQKTQEKTTIGYYGNKSYTLKRVQELLGVPVRQLARQPIANIVITIGKDEAYTQRF